MPEFAPGSTHTAVATFRSTAVATYVGELRLGDATSGQILFTVNGDTAVPFPITVPLQEGTYDVFLDIYFEDIVVARFQTTEPVMIVAPPTGWDIAHTSCLQLWSLTGGAAGLAYSAHVGGLMATYGFSLVGIIAAVGRHQLETGSYYAAREGELQAFLTCLGCRDTKENVDRCRI